MCRIEFDDRNLVLLRFVFGFWFRGDGESIRVVQAFKKQIAAIGELLLYYQVNKQATDHMIQCVSFTTRYGLQLTNLAGKFTTSANATQLVGLVWLLLHADRAGCA